MKYLAQVREWRTRKDLWLWILLPSAAAVIIYFLTRPGAPSPFLLIGAVIGISVVIFTFIYPEFGLAMSVVVPFFIFDLMRVLHTDAPLGSAVDLMVYLTFASVLLKKWITRESFWLDCDHRIVYLHLLVWAWFVFERFNPNGGSLELFIAIGKRNLSILLFLYCSIQVFRDESSMKRFLIMWLILSIAAGAYACYEEWLGMPKYELDYILEDPLRESLFSLDNGNYRKLSFMSGCTDFGLSMAGTIIIALTFFLTLKTTFSRKLVLFVGVLLMAFGMTYSGTRTATFMLVIEVVFYGILTIQQGRTLIFAGFFAFLFGFLMFAPIYGNPTINRLRSTFQPSTDASMQVRDINRKSIQPYIYSHPIGGGIGTTGVLNYQHNIGHPLAGFPTDSGFLSITLEQGWIGLIIGCLNWFIILQTGIHGFFRSRSSLHKAIFLAAITCIFGYVFAQYAQVAIGQVPNGFLFVALVAMIIRLDQMESKTHLLTKIKG